MRPLVALTLLAVIPLAGCVPTIELSDAVRVDQSATPQDTNVQPTVEPPAEPTPTPEPIAPIVVAGDGEANTAPIQLNGDYRVVWTVGNDCFYGADLEGADRESIFTASEPGSGETFLYDLRGEYYVQMITGPSPACPWSISFEGR